MTSRAKDILDSLPHREPFRFVTEVVELCGGESGKAIWRVTGREEFFNGHFPDNPIVPGVLIGEALAQLCGLIVVDRLCRTASALPDGGKHGVPGQGKLAHIELWFNDTVTPPADISLESRFERTLGSLWQFDTVACVGDRRVARGALTLSVPGVNAAPPESA